MSYELGRRAVHASGVGIPLLYLLGFATWTQVRWFAVLVAVVALVLEFFRIVAGFEHAIYDRLTREYEQDRIAGYGLYAISMALVAVLFVPVVATPGMVLLAIADPISGMLGSNEPHEHKAPQVWAAMFAVSFSLTAAIVVPLVGGVIAVIAAAAGAAGATIADCTKPIVRGVAIDDNLTIPPATAIGIGLVLWLSGIGPVVDLVALP